MSVPVLLFASYADAFGQTHIEAPLSPPCTVEALINALRPLPGGDRLPERPLVAINHKYARLGGTIEEGDEVALIPPVAGG